MSLYTGSNNLYHMQCSEIFYMYKNTYFIHIEQSSVNIYGQQTLKVLARERITFADVKQVFKIDKRIICKKLA